MACRGKSRTPIGISSHAELLHFCGLTSVTPIRNVSENLTITKLGTLDNSSRILPCPCWGSPSAFYREHTLLAHSDGAAPFLITYVRWTSRRASDPMTLWTCIAGCALSHLRFMELSVAVP
ncbi:hypothetical protein M404DRAFT_541848 [Pisolithus tinctorius Marx 270]|uniref:Uncharacterized protein n=1 Tax=Pisolithus tinctorius Marx 270 TaxID=870435 RepID=A0A0C3NVN3_PISTI|nr:hypothetical protein M404DRAFT_541848 [Pisolithus tinctorius Marx 270]